MKVPLRTAESIRHALFCMGEVGDVNYLTEIWRKFLEEINTNQRFRRLIHLDPLTEVKLSKDDICDWDEFQRELLGDFNSQSSILRGRLPRPLLDELATPGQALSQSRRLQRALLLSLNRLLQGPCLFPGSAIKRIHVRTTTMDLRRQKPTGVALARLNRMLFEDAFPGQLKHAEDKEAFLEGLRVQLDRSLRILEGILRSKPSDARGQQIIAADAGCVAALSFMTLCTSFDWPKGARPPNDPEIWACMQKEEDRDPSREIPDKVDAGIIRWKEKQLGCGLEEAKRLGKKDVQLPVTRRHLRKCYKRYVILRS